MRARMEGVRVQCLFRPMAVVDDKNSVGAFKRE